MYVYRYFDVLRVRRGVNPNVQNRGGRSSRPDELVPQRLLHAGFGEVCLLRFHTGSSLSLFTFSSSFSFVLVIMFCVALLCVWPTVLHLVCIWFERVLVASCVYPSAPACSLCACTLFAHVLSLVLPVLRLLFPVFFFVPPLVASLFPWFDLFLLFVVFASLEQFSHSLDPLHFILHVSNRWCRS